MKTNFTISILLCTFFASTNLLAQQPPASLFNFTATPILLAGNNNEVNSVYRFANVKTATDAIVTIVSATAGASVQILDDNSVAKPEAFSPNVRVLKNSTGLVEFKIEFVTAGSLIPLLQDSLYATAIDIDGNAQLHEIDVIDLHGGSFSYLAANPEIAVTLSGTAFTGTNIAGIEYAGIDTTARSVMFMVRHNNVTNFIYKCGASNTSNADVDRQKSLYFKDFIYAQGPLPLSYLYFDAVVNDKTVLLKWLTTNEINNSYFEVERSFDMNNYNSIGLVLDGFAVNGTGKRYEYKDNGKELVGPSMVYYRLKQFDINGRVNYSKVLAVRLQAKANTLMQIFPNPFVQNLHVGFTATESGVAEIRIITTTGQTLLSKQTTISKGYNNIQIDGLSGLATGMYVAQLILNGTVIDNGRVIKNAF